jgi:hypothetical protein
MWKEYFDIVFKILVLQLPGGNEEKYSKASVQLM